MDLDEGWRVRCLDDEPMYCEAPHDEGEVLYAGSDDEHYDGPDKRKSRYEEAAIRFLQGHTPVLLTTVLRGPFEGPDAKGWVNPWQSKRKTALAVSVKKTAPEHLLKITSPEREITEMRNGGSPTSCHLPSPRSLDQVDITPHPFLEEEDLERVESWRSTAESASRMEESVWSFDASLSQSQYRSQRKRRSVGSEWLKRDDNKRRKSGKVHDMERTSVTPQRNTPTLLQEPSGPRTPSRQKQQDTSANAEVGRKSLESPEASSSSPAKALHAVTNRSSQRLLSQPCDKQNSDPEMPAPLSTPVQTPESSRKSRITPGRATIGSRPRSSGATMLEQATRSGGEFETQQDDSFLFRARRREHVPAIQLSPLPRMSFGRVSSLACTTSSETDSDAELMGLDGDTCMADDTKATSPKSNAECNDHHGESLKKYRGLVVEQATRSEVENDRPQSEHSSGKSATLYTEDTLVATNHAPMRGLKQLEVIQSSPPIKQDVVVEVITEGSDQEPTVAAAHSASQKEKDDEPTDDVVRTSLPPTPASRLSMSTQFVPQPSTSQDSTMPKTFHQSPWSRLSQFPTSSPISWSDEGRQHLGHIEALFSGGTPAHDAPTTPLGAEVEREPASGSMNLSPQSEPGPLRIRAYSRIEKIISEEYSPAVPASQQSPWKADAPAMALPQQQQLPTEDGHGNFVDPSCQSPWTASPERIRQAAQAALLSTVSAGATPASPSPLAPPALMNSDALVVDRATDSQSAAVADTASPSSPEPIFCIKSFARFMSPSPERPRRRSNKIRLSDGHLPSTQSLIAATTDNPWESAKRSSKRVRWAPLPNENDNGEARCPQTPTGPRASSPPPETVVTDGPTGDDDQCQKHFQNHFQAVSRRKKLHHHLLPSASQQFLESPAPMAMAEAFVAADSFGAPPALEITTGHGETSFPTNTETQESALDDVDDVLLNLNEFIEMVDVEADLARTKEEERKALERQQQQQSQRLSGDFSSGLNFEGMMDAGVWD
ncbi:protamine P1 [Colletotrichum somersetense]|nr:protamine P1 [Colletotrichum somersetense]